jgi:rare lipoprotein A (peptidoglycan hydrolase)
MKKVQETLVLVFVALGLGACSTTSEGESANGKLCTGTKRPYQVRGLWHTPQQHYEYSETGTASWYGPKFHGRPKSCGEIFNMHGISAAHKTLPIPSVVRVTNVNNGQNVKLLIDDRGPFIGDRIIDLSKGAATYLGLCNKGLGTVHVECLPIESRAFADFVAQYGRYGRDPSGRPWEVIFRKKFDKDDSVPLPGNFVPGSMSSHDKQMKRRQLLQTPKLYRKKSLRRENIHSITARRSGRRVQGKARQTETESIFDAVAY